MKKPEKIEPVMEFVFQTIKLDQVADLVPHNYHSKYEAIRNQVIEKIKSMPEDETFMFQPQDRKAKLDDNLIARICSGINTGLVRESLNWKISYSNKASAFVVAPFKRYKHGKNKTAKSVVTQETPVIHKRGKITPDEARQITNLLKFTHQHFGKSLKDLQTKLNGAQNPELSSIKKAFLYVGHNAMGIKLARLGEMIGLSSASMTTHCNRAMKDPQTKEYVKVLSDAVTSNGGSN